MRFIIASDFEDVWVQHKDGTWGRLRQCLDGRYKHVDVFTTNKRDACTEECWRADDVVASVKRPWAT